MLSWEFWEDRVKRYPSKILLAGVCVWGLGVFFVFQCLVKTSEINIHNDFIVCVLLVNIIIAVSIPIIIDRVLLSTPTVEHNAITKFCIDYHLILVSFVNRYVGYISVDFPRDLTLIIVFL